MTTQSGRLLVVAGIIAAPAYPVNHDAARASDNRARRGAREVTFRPARRCNDHSTDHDSRRRVRRIWCRLAWRRR
jgi:hypothetical protein